MVETSQVSEYFKNAGNYILDACEWVTSSIESGCDRIAYYGEHTLNKGADLCSPLTDRVVKTWNCYTRPFWNIAALIYRYPLSTISWHLPKTILWMEGQTKLNSESPLYQRVAQIAQEMGITQAPDIYLKAPEAFSFLPEGGWGSLFQSALVLSETTSNASIKRSLKAVQYKETSIQNLSLIAVAIGMQLLENCSPLVQLTAFIGSWAFTYIATQITIDQVTAKNMSSEEVTALKGELNRSQVEPLPKDASIYAKIERASCILLSAPSYLRSLAL